MPGSNTYSMLSAQPAFQGSSTANGGGSALSSGSAPVSTSSGSILSSIGDVLGYIANPIDSLINFFANRSLSDRRNEQAVAQWMRENDYNLPKNQIQRLREAGLNPALMYENGANGLVSANSPDITMPALSPLSVIDPLTAAQIRNIDADTELKEKSSIESTSRTKLNEESISKTKKEVEQMTENIKLIGTEVEKNDELKKLFSYQSRQAYYDLAYSASILEDRVKQFLLDVSQKEFDIRKQVVELAAFPQLMANQIGQLRAMIRNLNADSQYKDRMSKLVEPQIDIMEKQKAQFDALLERIQKENGYIGAEKTQQIISGYVNSFSNALGSVSDMYRAVHNIPSVQIGSGGYNLPNLSY